MHAIAKHKSKRIASRRARQACLEFREQNAPSLAVSNDSSPPQNVPNIPLDCALEPWTLSAGCLGQFERTKKLMLSWLYYLGFEIVVVFSPDTPDALVDLLQPGPSHLRWSWQIDTPPPRFVADCFFFSISFNFRKDFWVFNWYH